MVRRGSTVRVRQRASANRLETGGFSLLAELQGTTAEVARRQPDGAWLYVFDNAWGDLAITS
jgi:hypothetical protein